MLRPPITSIMRNMVIKQLIKFLFIDEIIISQNRDQVIPYINDLLSSATAPLPNEANFDEYVSRCKNVFYKYFGNGHAELPFAVNCYIGRLDT